ncbi:TPA: hydrogenase large subunit [Candidatus Woesearchaeota archaeon]|nr:hydrogenase large subunit [Candidatus Woesearchaeota archaeon]HII68314.1 hydrogenase large subunit [Candidatus Woesearchaeota archaeon]
MSEFDKEVRRLFPSTRFEEANKGEVVVKADDTEIPALAQRLKEQRFSLMLLFAMEDFNGANGITLWYVFEKEGFEEILVIQAAMKESMESIAAIFPPAYLYEREIMDGFGVAFARAFDQRRLFLHEAYPEGFHPLLRSFRNMHIKAKKAISLSEEYPFKEVKGHGVYQIPVGPVHAGIIPPGHFRFSVIGETIFNLEIRHFWKHRGIEKLAEGMAPEEGLLLAQGICGDEAIANALAYCMAIEKICAIHVPSRAEHIRALFAEMERVYSLLGDIAGMVVDVAYPLGASPFFILREEMLRWNEALSGSRFLKGAMKIGGMAHDVQPAALSELSRYLGSFYSRFTEGINGILSSSMVVDRFETTGVVKKELVLPLHLSGPIARASGIHADVRVQHPYGLYQQIAPSNKVTEEGDVLARFRVKAATIKDSVGIIKRIIASLPSGKMCAEYRLHDGHAFSLVESSRGQNIHFISLGNGKIERYKVRTASFCNWNAIEHAVLGNIVPDFPLINKSMNLSYEGNDL